ncbi:ubiquitin-protein ligase [Moesziomyces antarcticus T-34]|uniref:Ubiquitin-protein ligase n=1 Tax=Pseudozyma antarctica (strain T-34) TaxID=1151754 RepID=M9LS27_PSEA3|nr:ubiquitin-protein ligase [Moesziomyces antarcticus T-34]
MIKIWSMKKEEESAKKKKPKTSPAQLRVQKDLTELELPKTMKTDFPDPADKLPADHRLGASLIAGMYKAGSFKFTFAINNNYPHDPPKVKCTQKVRLPDSQRVPQHPARRLEARAQPQLGHGRSALTLPDHGVDDRRGGRGPAQGSIGVCQQRQTQPWRRSDQ